MARTEQVAPSPGWSWARARTSVAAVPAVAWLVGLVALSTLLRFLLSRGVAAPFLFQDELLYSEPTLRLAVHPENVVDRHRGERSNGV